MEHHDFGFFEDSPMGLESGGYHDGDPDHSSPQAALTRFAECVNLDPMQDITGESLDTLEVGSKRKHASSRLPSERTCLHPLPF